MIQNSDKDCAACNEYFGYADGSYTSNKKNIIGYAFCISKNNEIIDIYNFSQKQENANSALAEVMSLLLILEHIKKYYPNNKITIFMDNKYVVDAFNEKIKTKEYKDIWLKIMSLKTTHITLNWVRGHINNPVHNFCDTAAKLACFHNIKVKLKG